MIGYEFLLKQLRYFEEALENLKHASLDEPINRMKIFKLRGKLGEAYFKLAGKTKCKHEAGFYYIQSEIFGYPPAALHNLKYSDYEINSFNKLFMTKRHLSYLKQNNDEKEKHINHIEYILSKNRRTS